MPFDPRSALCDFHPTPGQTAHFYSLPALEAAGFGKIARLPVSLRVILESVLRHLDGERITEAHLRQLADWRPQADRSAEIPFVVNRILLQDFTGVPLLCDLAAMRDAAARFGRSPTVVEPLVPVDLVVDHSVQIDYFREENALDLNMAQEFQRNAERYRFVKWGMQAFDSFHVVPPGVGIVHQVNLEHLARGLGHRGTLYYPDTLVGTDSHTTMINALGVVGWGVGGIEAEAGMLGQPLYILTPDVVGVHLRGQLREGVTATDLVLAITERLRQARVVGKFVEFFGPGAASLTVPDRATLANMAPEYGATLGFFPPDAQTAAYLTATGRKDQEVEAFIRYFEAQEMFGMPNLGDIDYSSVIEMDLAAIVPCIAGPKRPQDRIPLSAVKASLADLAPKNSGQRHPLPNGDDVGQGDVLIAAITSCTNTSNPELMLAAGLLARKALDRGLAVPAHVKTSLAPGSRVVTDYLERTGLLAPLERLGFRVVAYGCTTCIGNSGPLDAGLEQVVAEQDLICASVLSGNRNFEARIHPAIKANFLMSPPLVVAFALAGRINIDLEHEPLGQDREGRPVMMREIWPSRGDLAAAMRQAGDAASYRRLYQDFTRDNPLWNQIDAPSGETYGWTPSSYIARPPFFDDFTLEPTVSAPLRGARALAIFGDSITTDHISPAGSIHPHSPAGLYLSALGIPVAKFNSYGSRRGNHEVMMRGTFANVRIRNLMLPPGADGEPIEGGLTLRQPDGEQGFLYDIAMAYQRQHIPTIIFAGEDYGSGSSRDWAAKGTRLLGVRAVVARSFERIHRSNLVGMGVLPLQFRPGDSAASLGLTGAELFDLPEVENALSPGQELILRITRPDGVRRDCPVLLRIDTPIEVSYFRHGGILPYVLRQLIG
ncbi:aconitate hydratase [mine drainage metagenome]|uniref:Aconitate hydratase n=1 Tax=mine drainage metagenome TaxID=410659 RepID=A0A1J5SPZ0_9ZZZZ